MVLPIGHEIQFAFTAVLIDFDNSSIKGSVFCSNEKEKIEKECRLFNFRVGPYILMNWEWYDEVISIFTSYSTMKQMKISFEIILQFISYLKKHSKGTPLQKIKSLNYLDKWFHNK
jgi:hypothetical protein